MTDAQMKFLRACVAHPNGIPVHECPRPALLKRWMRRATFRRAMKGLRDALRFHSDLQLASACAAGATQLNAAMTCEQPGVPKLATQKEQIQYLTALLKLSHLRERFTRDYEQPEPVPPRSMAAAKRQEFMEFLRRYNPLQSVLMPLSDLERRERLENEQREKALAERRAA